MSTCKISAPTNHLGSVKLSPNSELVAYLGSANSKVIIADVNTNKVLSIFACIDRVDKFEWSKDSSMLLCAMYSRCAVQVFSVLDHQWNCRINEGLGGIVNAKWCPDSLHILLESDFGLQISIWALADSVSYIFAYPKPSVGTMCAFSECGRYMAIGHRIEVQDYIGVYSTSPWTELVKFKCRTNDLAHVMFVPQSTNIVTADSSLSCRLTVYSPSGDLLANVEPYQNALGLRSFAFQNLTTADGTDGTLDTSTELSVSHQRKLFSQGLLAVGSFDGKVRILSTRTWEVAFTLPMLHIKELVNERTVSVDVRTTVEVDGGKYTGTTPFDTDLWGSTVDGDTSIMNQSISLNSTASGANTYVYKNLKSLPKLSSSDVRVPNGFPKMGVHALSFAPNSPLLVVREEAHPRCLWVWDALQARLVALLVQLQPVLQAQWRPSSRRPLLAFCTGAERVYVWSETGSSWIDVPVTGLAISSIEWTADGNKIVLSSKSSYCVCDFNENDFI